MSNLTIKIGYRIKIERIRKKISQEKLAEIANLNKNTISLIERGEISPTIETLNSIAKSLDISLPDLVDISKINI